MDFNGEAEVMVSVCCIAYNHEKYIKEALDSFLMQKTNFRYEIIVHDDASTDHTTDIIREYAEKYPDIIRPIYQKENQYSKGVKIALEYIYPEATGKYIAICEGDDFWTDENKLQLQFDMMEKHPECSMCTHASYKVDVNSIDLQDNIRFYENESVVGLEEHLENMHKSKGRVLFQTSSFFFRTRYIKKMILNPPKFICDSTIGDIPLTLFMLTKGNIVNIDRLMSAYRIGREGSWTQNRGNAENLKKYLNTGIAMFLNFKDYYPDVSDKYINAFVYHYTVAIYLIDNRYDDIIKNRELKKYVRENYTKKQYLCILMRANKITNSIYKLYDRLRGISCHATN